MKLFNIAMVRNEIDILPEYLGHLDCLFDGGFLIDHLCCDGSQEVLQEFAHQRPAWSYQWLANTGFCQAEITSNALREAFRLGADAVFFLDADEFIEDHDRPSLEILIADLDAIKALGTMRWRNCLPQPGAVAFSLDQQFWHSALSPHRKIIIPRALFIERGERLGVNQGNHSLQANKAPPPPSREIGQLLHFPIRSRAQLMRKVIVSYVSQSQRPSKQIAPHIRAMFDLMLSEELSHEKLNALAAHYGSSSVCNENLSENDLKQQGFLYQKPRVARRQLTFSSPTQPLAPVIDFGIAV